MTGDDRSDDPLAEFLDGLGHEQQAELQAARELPSKPGRAERALADIMARDLDERPAAVEGQPATAARADELARLRRSRWWAWVAAAVLLVALGWGLRDVVFEASTSRDTLLGPVASGLQPSGPVTSPWGDFQFEAEVGGELWARISVYDAANPDGPPVRSPRLREPRWSASEAERATMADWTRIEWTVEIFTGTSAEVGIGPPARASAEHSPP